MNPRAWRPPFVSSWSESLTEILTLADACSEIVDCAHKTAPIDEHGEFFAVGTPAMRGNVINYAEARRINRATFEAWTTRLKPKHGDLLLAREAPVGPVVQIPKSENVAPGQRTVLLRPREGAVDPEFLYYYLISPLTQANLIVKAAGSTVPHLNVADVRSLRISGIPPLREQRAIAGVLAALDDKIAGNERILDSAEALMVMLAGTSAGRATLAELAEHSTVSVDPRSIDTTVAHYSLPAFDDSRTPELATGSSIKSNKFLLSAPCVLLSKLNPRIPRIWNVAVLPEFMALASTEFVVLKPRSISGSALWAAASHPAVSEKLQALVSGTSGSHQRVKPSEMLTLSITDPRQLPDHVLRQIDDLGRLVDLRKAENRRLAATRDELLPLLMSGKVRVGDAGRFLEGV